MTDWIPADRILAIVDGVDYYRGGKHGNDISRRMCELRSGRQKFVSLRVADRILTHLDLNHLWHIPRAHGGLADIYEDGAGYGRPANYLAFSGARQKYDNDSDRLEARRRTWRESKRRRRAKEAA